MDPIAYFPEDLRTDRFILRRPRPTDAPAIYAGYAVDAEVTRYLSWAPHKSLDETQQFLGLLDAEWNSRTGFAYMICPQDAPDEILGNIHAHVHGHQVSFGYVLRRDSWGQGCASEVLGFLANHALTHPDVFRAFAFCDVDNPASARVMAKAGMQFEGTLRRHFRHPNISSQPRDCVLYARVK